GTLLDEIGPTNKTPRGPPPWICGGPRGIGGRRQGPLVTRCRGLEPFFATHGIGAGEADRCTAPPAFQRDAVARCAVGDPASADRPPGSAPCEVHGVMGGGAGTHSVEPRSAASQQAAQRTHVPAALMTLLMMRSP